MRRYSDAMSWRRPDEPRDGGPGMQLRVVVDQPWDVAADVLAIPVAGEFVPKGALAEIDKRSGCELAAQAAFGELKAERYSTAVMSGGELRAPRLLAIAAGEADTISRQVVVRIGSAIEQRLAGRTVKTLAVWLGDLGDRVDGGAA